MVKCYFWSIAEYGAEAWIHKKLDQKCPGSSEMCFIRMGNIVCSDHVKNEEGLLESRMKGISYID